MTTRIARWGNSLAVRLPRSVVQTARLTDGQTVNLSVADDGTISLQPLQPRRLQLERLVAAITDDNRHEETEWGERMGRETW